MNHKENKKSLDELITGTVKRDNLKFDFDKWKNDHKKQIQEFQTHQSTHSGCRQCYGFHI